MSKPPASDSSLPVPSGPVVNHDDAPRARKARATGGATEKGPYAAQVLGGGEKRGLKGGPETLGRAKSTYLQSEYSGPNDRRPRPGRITKTDI